MTQMRVPQKDEDNLELRVQGDRQRMSPAKVVVCNIFISHIVGGYVVT